jgi:hypothetical protein
MLIPNAGFGLLSFRSSDYLVWFDDSVVSPCGDESAILRSNGFNGIFDGPKVGKMYAD